ncbi:hypothetical protein K1T71_011723 [Dendrolimus kikuchii]|uniref:Uncharacterized protein n=1 Tax=Dendrolimus kikuchii TaxID=765133 RepID=A0ACC1CMD5_9NEOP|nr:hypothetical protein K1T71_011723 [Dendrolimus kikuchii]
MPSSDSEDFESADEGHTVEKKERKKRSSSSNYSDNALENDPGFKEATSSSSANKPAEISKETDGWDDWDIDDNETLNPEIVLRTSLPKPTETSGPLKKEEDKKDTDWDDFDAWGQEIEHPNAQPSKADPQIKEVTNKMAATSTGGWGWGWSVDSILSTATAGISTITSQVSQGISTVLETGIGAPDPEELARKTSKDIESRKPLSDDSDNVEKKEKLTTQDNDHGGSTSDGAFPFGSLLSGVTKFVETTGTKVIAGGLDTLETIGKKTMEVLQDGDPGLAKKRAMLGLDPGDKPVLSQVLREAKAKAEEEDRVREEKREAKEVHYENLFDDFEGLVHLEALEMLSRQVSMRIEERMRGLEPDKRQDLKETLQQVAELCEMPEEEDDAEETPDGMSKADALHEKLQIATQDLGLKLQFQPIVKQYTEILNWLSTEDPTRTDKGVYKRGVSALAQATSLCVEIYHKAGEMLLVKARRSTADEADSMTQMTVVLTKHISELATLFTEKLNTVASENMNQVNNYITNIFLEAGNSSTYIQNAFQLTLPILQIGAV